MQNIVHISARLVHPLPVPPHRLLPPSVRAGPAGEGAGAGEEFPLQRPQEQELATRQPVQGDAQAYAPP